MAQVIHDSLGQERLTMSLLAAFALLALLLALVGIYGAVAYTVEQRTGEIGVRLALGAQARDVLQLILSQGMQPVAIGLVIGLAVVLALGRLLASQLYQISAHNPLLLGGTTICSAWSRSPPVSSRRDGPPVSIRLSHFDTNEICLTT